MKIIVIKDIVSTDEPIIVISIAFNNVSLERFSVILYLKSVTCESLERPRRRWEGNIKMNLR
jgi:hypothetical protein